MFSEMAADISADSLVIEIVPELTYTPASLEITAKGLKISIHASNEQFAEIEYAIRQYLEQKRFYETPDQQHILNEEYEKENDAE